VGTRSPALTIDRVRAGYNGFLDFAKQVDVELAPFQRKIARTVLSNDETLVLISRGNGKSFLIGLLAVHHLLTTKRAAIYLAAASREQARIVYEYARDFALHDSIAEQITVRHLELRAPDGGHLRVLASDAPKLHGLSPTLAVVDELHAFSDDNVYLALRSAMAKRGGRMVTISTAGTGAESPLGALRRRALASPVVKQAGALTTATGGSIAMLEWAVPEEADITSDKVVKAANPAPWLTAKALAGQRAGLPDAAFRRFQCGQWLATENAVFPPGAWQACAGDASIEPGSTIVVGIDAGRNLSDTAICWLDDQLHVGVEVLTGERAVADIDSVVDELATSYRIREIVVDPWHVAGALTQSWEQRGLLVSEYPQFDSRLIPGSARLYSAVIEQRLVHPDDPKLNEHVAGSIAVQSRRGWRIGKAKGQNNDSLVALLMALDRIEHQPVEVKLLGWL
jgi:phage terminase large subunit-like protein